MGAAGTALFAGEALAQAGAGALRPVKVMTSLPTLTSAPTYVMQDRKFDQARGLTVTLQQTGGSSSLQIDGVLSKNADFGFPGTATALQAIREGADLRILGAYCNNQIATVVHNDKLKALGVGANAPIAERIKALKGMTIGTNPVGATYTQMLRYYLKQNGIDPDNDVRLVGIAESSALISGIQQGRFDAICTASGIVEQAISLGVGTLWFSGARGDIPGTDRTMVGVVIARGETVDKEAAYVDRFRAAIDDALNALNNDRGPTGQLLYDKYLNKLDRGVWDMVWNGAKAAYPARLSFPRAAYDFWIGVDPKGADSYKGIDYRKITYGPAQG
jgi:NitT/TauT family transport system substrate-binding protein